MNIGIIVAGGTGSRMGMADKPKQFVDVYGKPIFIHTLEAFDINDRIDGICVVTRREWMDDINIWLKRFDIRKVRWMVESGEERRDSCYNGLKAVEKDVSPDDIMLIHDSARPLLTQRIINENIDVASQHGTAHTCIPTSDTIVRSIDGGKTMHSQPARTELYMGQTPQTFKFSIIMEAQEHYRHSTDPNKPAIFDDVGLVLYNGGTVAVAKGDPANIKVTTFNDVMLVKALIRSSRSYYSGT